MIFAISKKYCRCLKLKRYNKQILWIYVPGSVGHVAADAAVVVAVDPGRVSDSSFGSEIEVSFQCLH